MIKETHKNLIKIEVVNKINRMRRVFQKRRNMKKFYCCGSGTHMLNNFEIKDTIEKYQCFYRTLNLQGNLQQASDKGDEQTV